MNKYYVMPFIKIFLTVSDLIIILELINRVFRVLERVSPGNIIQLITVIVLLGIGIYLFIFLFRYPIIQLSSDKITINIPFSKQSTIKIPEIDKVVFYNSTSIQCLMKNKNIIVIKIHLLTTNDKNILINNLLEYITNQDTNLKF